MYHYQSIHLASWSIHLAVQLWPSDVVRLVFQMLSLAGLGRETNGRLMIVDGVRARELVEARQMDKPSRYWPDSCAGSNGCR